LLAQVDDVKVKTAGIIGSYGDHTVDVLNQLCAICSSSDPIIFQHEIKVHDVNFDVVWPKSNLGLMTEHSEQRGGTFHATIKYPEI
jgi:hypothetical protein